MFLEIKHLLENNHRNRAVHSSNINEVIRSVLNFLFIYFFYDKISQVQKNKKNTRHQKALKSIKNNQFKIHQK